MSWFHSGLLSGLFFAIARAIWLRLEAKANLPKAGSLAPEMVNGAAESAPPQTEPDNRRMKRFRSGSSAVNRSARRFMKLRMVSLVCLRMNSSLKEFIKMQAVFVPAPSAMVTDRVVILMLADPPPLQLRSDSDQPIPRLVSVIV